MERGHCNELFRDSQIFKRKGVEKREQNELKFDDGKSEYSWDGGEASFHLAEALDGDNNYKVYS